MRANPLGFYGLLQQHRDGQPNKPAVATGDEVLSYTELVDRVDRLTAVLHERAIGPGDRVLWLGQNAHQVLELLVACARVGALFCPANWRQSVEEFEYLVADFDPQLVVSQQEPASTPDNWITVEGDGGYEELIRSATPLFDTYALAEPDIGRGLLVLYTAAFSGKPAGAILTEHGLYLQGVAHIPVLHTTHEDINLVATPLFHILAWVALLPALIVGGTNIFVARPDPHAICCAIAHGGATTGPLMPATAMQIAELNADGRYDLGHFRSALPIAGWRDMTAPGTTVGGYGQTETGGPVLLGLPGAQLGGAIQGRPSPVARVRIADEDGRDVPAAEIGEILVSGPTVTCGFWNRPTLSAERRSGDWWRTRDLGRRDLGGVITFVGPKLRMIKTGGENVYPLEVENCLETHPGVLSAALIGCPDERWGQLVNAVVVRRPENPVDAEALTMYVRDKLATYKAPRAVHFIDEMPMTAAGKDYAGLDARFGGGYYPGMS
jgi:acyl-CoA synthetase (AMP-forming)/AMP-acid ligase II